MIKATLGFIFSSDHTEVLLIEKQRPAWQVGKLNGLGGKCEGEETAVACISREIQEECNLTISSDRWSEVAELKWQEWEVSVFTVVLKKHEDRGLTSLTDEVVSWCPVNNLPSTILSNLSWLIPLALDKLHEPTLKKVIVTYD
ncbi:MAG TPA: NUDIX domain-containing protein [Vitreimonas sp.]|nr:NUDIX domain-containing protein [Vitreimonas sp.]